MTFIVSYPGLLWGPIGEKQMRTVLPAATIVLLLIMLVLVLMMIWIWYSSPPASVQAGAIRSKQKCLRGDSTVIGDPPLDDSNSRVTFSVPPAGKCTMGDRGCSFCSSLAGGSRVPLRSTITLGILFCLKRPT